MFDPFDFSDFGSSRTIARTLASNPAAISPGAPARPAAPIPRAFADDADDANRYGGCLAAQKSGDLLLLLDESSSLQSTDAKAALGRYADRVGADLDVAIAGFADTYMLHQNWTKLSSDTADSVGQQLDPQASRNTGVDTEILPTT
jgi:outer membrane protein OmpA-like peptidoglycan-associated protein